MGTKLSTFAAVLAYHLDVQNLTGVRLAKLTGISTQAIYRFLDGSRLPSFGCLLKISKALNISLAAFDHLTAPK